MSCEIPLARGGVAIVDECDEALVHQHRWHLGWGAGKSRYASTGIVRAGKRTTILMHRLIMTPPPRLVVDHINGDGLDNRRANLRIVPHRINLLNRHSNQPNKHGYHGLVQVAGRAGFYGRVTVDGRQIYTRRCGSPEEAAAERDKLMMAAHPGQLVFRDYGPDAECAD